MMSDQLLSMTWPKSIKSISKVSFCNGNFYKKPSKLWVCEYVWYMNKDMPTTKLASIQPFKAEWRVTWDQTRTGATGFIIGWTKTIECLWRKLVLQLALKIYFSWIIYPHSLYSSQIRTWCAGWF